MFPDISWRPELRVFHESELPIVWGTYNQSSFNVNGVAATQTEMQLSKYVQGAWAAFARDPANGLKAYGWPTYSPNTASLVRLGNSTLNATGMVLGNSSDFDTNCGANLLQQLQFGVQILTQIGG